MTLSGAATGDRGENWRASPAPAAAVRLAPVRLWLFVLAALVIAMVSVGGATRLTGSGLSITEWRPVTGTLPPLSAEGWEGEFAKYRASPQYDLLNRGMNLDEFKPIYLWEWGHRLLGRIIGLAFFVPLLAFWATGRLRGRLALALLGVGALGALQGLIGWIMVASGLEPGMIAVAPIKLTLHLVTASAILALLVWTAAGLGTTERAPVPTALRRGAALLLGLVVVQIGLGGLVAGAKAGLTYNTWPLMDGRLAPPLADLFARRPLLENLVDNPALVQLDHRIVAYLLVGLALWHAWRASALGGGPARRARALAGLVLAQMALGIVTLVLVVPLWAGLLHQFLAMLVLAMATVHLRLCRGAATSLAIAAPAGRGR